MERNHVFDARFADELTPVSMPRVCGDDMYSKSTRSLCLTDATMPTGQGKAVVCVCFSETLFRYSNEKIQKAAKRRRTR